MMGEKGKPFETVKCVDCPDIFLCPYLSIYQCPKHIIETRDRESRNE